MTRGQEIESLEQRLLEDVEKETFGLTDMLHYLNDLAFDSWSDLFEALRSESQTGSIDLRDLYWRTITSLEMSIDTSSALRRYYPHREWTPPDWQALLAKASRRLHLITAEITGTASNQKPTSQLDKASKDQISDIDEKQRSLDRVTTLGGVLLPISLTTGILGMSDPFSPVDGKFWIFCTYFSSLCRTTPALGR